MKSLITNEFEYKCGQFPKFPEMIDGQDTLLINEKGGVCLVNDHLTIKDIRKGKYNRVVRISTLPRSCDISFTSISKDKPYEFDITIGVKYYAENSVTYYTNKESIDISDCIKNMLSRIIIPIAKQYELTDDSIDEAILNELSGNEYKLESLGIIYSVISANVKPASNAIGFLKQISDAKINVRIEKNKIEEANKLTECNMELAIMSKVVSGEMDTQTAIEAIRNSNRKEGFNKLEDIERVISFIRNLQENNLISDDIVEQNINKLLIRLPDGISNSNLSIGVNISQLEENTQSTDTTLDDLLPDED